MSINCLLLLLRQVKVLELQPMTLLMVLERYIDLVFDPTTGSVVALPVQFGNDVGIKRFISITEDAINQGPLINGIRYYFAVTAYNYNPEFGIVPNNLENPFSIFTLIPQSNNPGVTYGEEMVLRLEITHVGTADGIVTATIVDPTATTGNDYQVFFSSQQQIRNEDGDWVPGGTVLRKYNPNDPDTLTGTTIDIAAVYGPNSASIDLNFHLDVVHHYYGWVDGVTLEFPCRDNHCRCSSVHSRRWRSRNCNSWIMVVLIQL